MWNPKAPFITLVLSMAFALALFMGKRVVFLFRWDDKKEQLKVHLKEDFPIFYLTIIVAVVVFFCCFKSTYNNFISDGLVLAIWLFLCFVLYHILFWPSPNFEKTSEELKEEYGEKLCPYCNSPLDIEIDAYVCRAEGCNYKYYLEDLPEYKPEWENKIKIHCRIFMLSFLMNITFYFAEFLFKFLIKLARSY